MKLICILFFLILRVFVISGIMFSTLSDETGPDWWVGYLIIEVAVFTFRDKS